MTQEDRVAALQAQLVLETKRADDAVAIAQALREEFARSENDEQTIEIARKAIKDILPLAIERTTYLIANAESESVQASLSRYVIDSVLTHKLVNNGDGTVADLIKKLAANDKNFESEAEAAHSADH